MGGVVTSPFIALLFPIACFITAYQIDEVLWAYYFDEPSYIHNNTDSLLYFIGFNLSFIFGLLVCPNFNFKFVSKVETRFIYILATFPIVFVLIFFIYAYSVNNQFFYFSFSGNGDQVKILMQEGDIGYNTLVHYLTPILWFCFWQYLMDKSVSGVRYSHYVIFFAIFSVVMLCIVTAARYAMIPLIVGLILLNSNYKLRNKGVVNIVHLLKDVTGIFFAIIGIFILFVFIRNGTDVDVLKMILGYGPVSFNRFSALNSGVVDFRYAADYVYLIPTKILNIYNFLFELSYVNDIEIWRSEFEDIAKGGLNNDFIWLSVYGYVFNSIGDYTFLWFFFYGLIASFLYQSFKAGSDIGIIFYPLMYFSIIFFVGSIYFIQVFFMYLISYVFIKLSKSLYVKF